ncbi:MAG: nicotinate-nucleotide pyrophosphorylase (carboxylating) [Candidatus Marinamargulisbacteria bacterium]|jgi:nicotinate-nucleotide pyrophosphorylase (carboxylating)
MKIEKDLLGLLKNALDEDRPETDITSAYFLPENPDVTASIISRQTGIFYGEEIIHAIFKVIGEKVDLNIFCPNGSPLEKNQRICSLKGPIKPILLAERVMLNFIQRLSGISTTTAQFVEELDDPSIKILDTRKTTPLLRSLERNAVKAGGGVNHRFSLSDMVLLKENHLSQWISKNTPQSLADRIARFKKENPDILVEIEVESINQLTALDLSSADIIMFDNFSLPQIEEGVTVCKNQNYQAEIEISGNVSLETIHQYAGLDIQRISIGSLTHSVRALDLSLLIQS